MADYTLIARPIDSWPGVLRSDTERKPSDFTADWGSTTDLLAREVVHLAGRDAEVILQLAVTDREIRNDGWIRSDAQPSHPGVIVSFVDSKNRPLRFSTDRFRNGSFSKHLVGWKANVRAVALALEALRKVDRYGIGQGGEQYQGWAQLGSGEPVALGASTMSVDEAARVLLDAAHLPTGDASRRQVIVQADLRTKAFREAARRTHPDTEGGNEAAFKLVNEAKTVLDTHAPIGGAS